MRISDWSSDVCSSDLSVISTRFAWPLRNSINRTRSPTATASSTREASMRGVDPATSTPQLSSHSHSLRGSLTDRKSAVKGTSVSERLDLGGRRNIKKTTITHKDYTRILKPKPD